MSRNQTSCDNRVDEDYIDMELSSSSTFISISIGSPPQTREFEFQMTSSSSEKEPTTSPADELFYKGKLLPLHLPPRLQMVQNLLEGSNPSFEQEENDSSLEENCSFQLNNDLNRSYSTYSFSPLESCSISTSEFCRVSCELNSEESFLQWSTEMSGFQGDHVSKKSWSRKLKEIKQSLMGPRLKASKAYIKSLFNKSGCSVKSCSNAACNADAEESGNDNSHCKKAGRKSHFEAVSGNRNYQRSLTLLKAINKEMLEDGVVNSYRRSFSGAIQRHSTTKSSSVSTSSTSSSCSSSFSFNSNGLSDVHLFKRSGSANSETESSIEGAIAYCKQSQQLYNSIATANEARVC